MILSFKPQFVKPILKGEKIHTIRLDPHKRWKAGMTIHFATGVRTKAYRQFHEAKCHSVQEIKMMRSQDDFIVLVDDRQINSLGIALLSIKDGFYKFEDFRDWFLPEPPVYPHDFEEYNGRIIHWTEIRY